MIRRCDGNIQCAGGTGINRVGGLRNCAAPACNRGEGVVAVGGDGQSAFAGDGGGGAGDVGRDVTGYFERGYRERVVNITVIGQHIARGRDVFNNGFCVGNQDGGIVNRCEQDSKCAGFTGGNSICHLWHAAVPIGNRGEGVGAVGSDGEGSYAGDGGGLTGGIHSCVVKDPEARNIQRVVNVAVIGKHVAGSGGVFGYDLVIGDQHGSVIHRCHRDVKRAGGPGADCVGNLRNCAVPVGSRGEGVVAVGGYGQGALAGNGGGGADSVDRGVDGEAADRERVVNVAVIGQYVASGGGVFGYGFCVGGQD